MKRSIKKKMKFDHLFDHGPEGPLKRAQRHQELDRTFQERALKRMRTTEIEADDRTMTEQLRDLGIEQPLDVMDEYTEREVETFDDHYPEPEVTSHVPRHPQRHPQHSRPLHWNKHSRRRHRLLTNRATHLIPNHPSRRPVDYQRHHLRTIINDPYRLYNTGRPPRPSQIFHC